LGSNGRGGGKSATGNVWAPAFGGGDGIFRRPFVVTFDSDLEGNAPPMESVLDLGGSTGADSPGRPGSNVGALGVESTSDNARARSGGAGGGTLRGGGAGGALWETEEPGPALDGLFGGGGGALPGVVGGPGIDLLGTWPVCRLFLGGMAGTCRVTAAETGRGGVSGGALFVGDTDGGTGAIRDGKFGTIRLGVGGAGDAGFGGGTARFGAGTDLEGVGTGLPGGDGTDRRGDTGEVTGGAGLPGGGGGGAAGEGLSRLGIEGGLPRVGCLPV